MNFIRKQNYFTKKGDLIKLKKFVKKTKFLFKDAVGLRHTDYIAYKMK